MSLKITGKSIDIGEALRERIKDRITEVMAPYVKNPAGGHVTVSKEGHVFKVECFLLMAGNIPVQAEAFGDDAYAACDAALQKIEKRLRRHKSRIKDRHREGAPSGIDAASYVIESPNAALDAEADNDDSVFHPVIIAEATTKLDKYSVAGAVEELDLTGAPFLLFRHAGHGRVNIVYRRPDGHVGWIDPPAT